MATGLVGARAASVGLGVGLGVFVGAWVGTSVAVAVGLLMAVADGSVVGIADGSVVGVADGSVVGVADSSVVGVADGSRVSVTLGTVVGIAVFVGKAKAVAVQGAVSATGTVDVSVGNEAADVPCPESHIAEAATISTTVRTAAAIHPTRLRLTGMILGVSAGTSIASPSSCKSPTATSAATA